ncbi:MAG: exo-alpha-sialidase, partial [Zetaproteobacteria bacterium]|nr:exo-alpha-sialidase [Flavobacteriales bacterium]
MIRYLLLFFLILSYSTYNLKAQQNKTSKLEMGFFKNVKIFEQKRGHGMGPSEPSIFINPKNTNNIVVGSIIDFVH